MKNAQEKNAQSNKVKPNFLQINDKLGLQDLLLNSFQTT
jgi:hypothetical protein